MGIVKWARAEWDRASAVLAVLAGAVFLIVGYVETSNTPHLAEQMPIIISGGLGGIFLLSVGAVLWITADMRDEWRELRIIRSAMSDMARHLENIEAGQQAAISEPLGLAAPSPARPRRRTSAS